MTPTGELFDRLHEVIRHLRSPEGCAWDREQTAMTLRASLIEEAYECVDAIERADHANLAEELGDVYLMVTMIGEIEAEKGSLTVADALRGVAEKLVRRHPHVFGDSSRNTVDEILVQWDQIKAAERPASDVLILDSVPRSMPPLERAFEIQKKVSKVGFDWKQPEPVLAKLEEEVAELNNARADGDQESVESEIGDVLFTAVNLARLLGVDPARALAATNRKFQLRFDELERRVRSGERGWDQLDLEALDRLWEAIKAGR